MGVYEDEEVGDGRGEGEGRREEGPCIGVRIEDYRQESWWWFYGSVDVNM